MRKLILFLSLSVPSLVAIGQDSKNENQPSIFFRLGAGYATRTQPQQGGLDKDGQEHFKQLRQGFNPNFQAGFFIDEKNAFALVYTRYAGNAETTILGRKWDSESSTSFVGITYQRFIPVGDKKDVNFNVKLGPGLVYYKETSLITAGATSTQSDFYKRLNGIFTGAGFDFKLSKNIRFDASVDKTWAGFKQNGVRNNVGFFAIGGGFRFQF
jgi:hypothetical protein